MTLFWRWNNRVEDEEDLLEYAEPTQSPDYSEVDDSDEDHEDDFTEDEWEGRTVRHLIWEDTNHYEVLTQIYGSAWPKVLPYCIFNVILTCLIFYLKHYGGTDLTVNPSGHKYMAPLMSFLLVTRLKITFDCYMSQSKNLQALYKSCRDLVATLCLLSANDTGKRAKQWRQDVAYSSLVLLRVAIGVLEFRSSHEDPWLLPEMAQENSDEVAKYSFKDHHIESSLRDRTSLSSRQDEENTEMPSLKRRLAHVEDCERKILEEASRAVFVLAWNVRREIMKQRDGTWFRSRSAVWQHPCNEETKLLDFVAEFLTAFSGLYKTITTPMPMPLVQMNKIFLFVWLFTLPLTLCHTEMSHIIDSPVVTMIVVFMTTFGFMGLEFVSMELSDPFGNDPSDFDDLGHAQLAMEDCYICIYRLDGKAWAKALRKRLKTKEKVDMPQTSPPSLPEGFSF